MMNIKQLALDKSAVLSQTLPALTFAVPFIISGPQWLTGTVVNSLLLLSIGTSKKISWPVVILPSLGALMHGVIFGPFTVFLAYFLPFIWLGNFIYMKVFQALGRTLPIPAALLIGALLKFVLIYLIAFLYYQAKIVPQMFLTSMGVIQLYTALSGGLLAILLSKFLRFDYE